MLGGRQGPLEAGEGDSDMERSGTSAGRMTDQELVNVQQMLGLDIGDVVAELDFLGAIDQRPDLYKEQNVRRAVHR